MVRRTVLGAGLVVAFVASLAVPASAATVTVAAAGDIARSSLATPQQQTADLVTGYNPTAVLALGDEQYPAGALSDFNNYYDKSWGAFKSITYPVPGNHEYLTSGASGYYNYFGSAAGDPSKGYYAYDLGSWRIYALNSECANINCSAEKTWFKNDLASDGSTCELAYYHRTGSAWPRTLMKNDDGDIVLAGHKHIYERYAPENGLLHFTVGTGGYSLGNASKSTAQVHFAAYGILELSLTDGGYSWSFEDVDGHVRDSGSGSCV
jgi:calcineurin-like phosphoesterase family protein